MCCPMKISPRVKRQQARLLWFSTTDDGAKVSDGESYEDDDTIREHVAIVCWKVHF